MWILMKAGRRSVLSCRRAGGSLPSVVIRLPRVMVHLEMGDAGEVNVVLRNAAAAIKSIFYGKLREGLCVCKGLVV